MKKRSLQRSELEGLRNSLQAATLAAIMGSRRWEPGDIAFQGGTCLHLVHGSPRFSEDVDFMIRGGMSVDALSSEVKKRIAPPLDMASDLSISVTPIKSERNPRTFFVVASGDNVLGSVRVKVELWSTPELAMDSLRLVVRPVVAGRSQSFVPALTLEEILADKVYALGARDRIKPRDVFDLWWLATHHPEQILDVESFLMRLEIYPAEDGERLTTAQKWLEGAQKRLQDLLGPQAPELIFEDLGRWLPSTFVSSKEDAAVMISASADFLRQGLALMQSCVEEMSEEPVERDIGG